MRFSLHHVLDCHNLCAERRLFVRRDTLRPSSIKMSNVALFYSYRTNLCLVDKAVLPFPEQKNHIPTSQV